MLALLRSSRSHRPRSAGFTLVELMVTLVIFALVAVAVTLVLQNSAKSKQRTASRIESEQSARAALDLMTRDIRTAGYGADLDASPLKMNLKELLFKELHGGNTPLHQTEPAVEAGFQ